MDDTKTCTRCGVEKPLIGFRLSGPTYSEKRAAECRACGNARARTRYAERLAMPPLVDSKLCGRCAQEKPASEFYRHVGRLDGLLGVCKECKLAEVMDIQRQRKARMPKESVSFDGTKVCRTCRLEKPKSDFNWNPRKADGVDNQCRLCFKWRAEARVAATVWESATKLCTGCRRDLPATSEYFSRNCNALSGFSPHCKECAFLDEIKFAAEHMGKMRGYGQASRVKLRIEVLRHYGGSPPHCSCCGDSHLPFLAIDHIGGGGNKHRKSLGGKAGLPFYAWLRDQGFPAGFRVLCHNCNLARGFYGHCPHDYE